MSGFDYDVVIIGAGPSGIAAATGLLRAGVSNILVLEREAEIGGIPRHTHHPSFGFLVFRRPMSGPRFIKKIHQRCDAVRFETSTTVSAIHTDGQLDLVTPQGAKTIRAKHIVLATGARETPRHSRLISGLRPAYGVMTTGTLQQFIYTGHMKPFRRVVIIGTELVSFSALWTLRHAGIKAVAMIEQNDRISAYRPATIFARLLRVPIHYRSKLVDISGATNVSQIEIQNAAGQRQIIACDGVVFTGQFTGDNNLARASHIALHPDTQIPLMDQNWQSMAANISVIGNTTHPADMGDQCYIEGLNAGRIIAQHLTAPLRPAQKILQIRHDKRIKMTTPNMVRVGENGLTFSLNLQVTEAFFGVITVKFGNAILYQKRHNCLPTRRITLKGIRLEPLVAADEIANIQIVLTA